MPTLSSISYNDAVFINCPFDSEYTTLLQAIVFCVYRCGFLPLSALSEDNGLQNKLQKIEHYIEQCKYGIHDISRTELNDNGLPRFNMPFELGIFYGAKHFGDKVQKTKNAVILDSEKFRYQQFISDLNGVDIKAHNNDPEIVIRKIRDWLATSSRRKTIPGHAIIQRQFRAFDQKLSSIAESLGFESADIPFNDFCLIVEEAIREFINE